MRGEGQQLINCQIWSKSKLNCLINDKIFSWKLSTHTKLPISHKCKISFSLVLFISPKNLINFFIFNWDLHTLWRWRMGMGWFWWMLNRLVQSNSFVNYEKIQYRLYFHCFDEFRVIYNQIIYTTQSNLISIDCSITCNHIFICVFHSGFGWKPPQLSACHWRLITPNRRTA